jgi:long-chain acyl-CoA synthetase
MDYATLDGFARRFGGALKGLGLKPGQHVALLLPNVPHFTIAYFGGHYAATPIVPLNVLLTADEIAYHLEDSDAVAIVAWELFAPQAMAAASRVPTCKHVIIAKADRSDISAPEGAHSFTRLVATSEAVTEVPATMPDDTAVVLYTSGTTAGSGAELTHFISSSTHYARTMLTAATHADVARRCRSSTASGRRSSRTRCSRPAAVVLPRFDAEAAFQLIQKYRIRSSPACRRCFVMRITPRCGVRHLQPAAAVPVAPRCGRVTRLTASTCQHPRGLLPSETRDRELQRA